MGFNAGMLAAGVLLLLGIVSNKVSVRVGVPGLVLFLGLGMLAGSEGPGGVDFEDYALANSIGSAALALILFDGGLRTTVGAVRATWRPALVLSTLGVVVTSGVTGAAAAWILDVSMLHGMLLGAIVGSTDAAAVFSVLRTSGLKLPERLSATLEVESGANDPMAVFLTLALVEMLGSGDASAGALAQFFALQFGVGTAVGLGVGAGAVWALRRVHLDHAGLYPLLALAFGMLAFGLAASLGGSGFLAVYLAGIVLGNRSTVFRRGVLSFHDAAAWLGQIVLFVMLGLLSFPSQVVAEAAGGFAVALVLLFVARPLAVVASVLPFGFRAREIAFLSWVGLKGAVPITLATFPLLAGISGSVELFNVVFFIVLLSAALQGGTLPRVARALRLGEPADTPPPLSVEINALRDLDGEIVDYTVAPSARVAGQALRDLALPDGVAVTLVVRGAEVIVPRGATTLRPGDHVFVALRLALKPLMDRLFDPYAETPPLPMGLSIHVHAASTLGQLHRFFGFPGPTWSEEPIGDRLAATGGGGTARLGPFAVTAGPEPDYVTLTVAYDESDADASRASALTMRA